MDARFSEVVTTEAQFRTVIGQPSQIVLRKHVRTLDGHCRAFIARCPFLLLASADAAGNMDVSPKGDPPGFVRVLDDSTLAIPDRPGNRKADTFCNLLLNPRVGLLFLVPGRQDTLRVNGAGKIVRDRWLREELVVSGKTPDFAIVVTVEEVFFHCPKCAIRSRLWNPEHWPETAGLASFAQATVDAGKLEETPGEVQVLLDRSVRERLY
ncbi:MAG: MSMEG_1061 family FMN-dependent PPOX-type flavoprotein [Bacteroidota bacterium]